MVENITTYSLEMLSPRAFKPKSESHGLIVSECEIDDWEVNRFLYKFVGKDWHWTDKLTWSDRQWKDYVSQPNLKTWIGYCHGSIAGYFELLSDSEGNVEIMYFGLAKSYIGKGFGGYFLSKAIEYAWSFNNARRVWVHTCTLDHPSALANYRARGFSIFKEETESVAS